MKVNQAIYHHCRTYNVQLALCRTYNVQPALAPQTHSTKNVIGGCTLRFSLRFPGHLHLCACVGCVQPTGWGLSAALCIPLSMPLLSSSLSSLSFTALHAHLVHTHKAQQRSPFFLGVFPEFHCVTHLGQHLSLDADIFGIILFCV